MTTKRAAIYVRVSTQAQVERGNGLAAQLTQCKAMLVVKGWQDAGTWSDNGVSGTTDASKRPGLSGLMVACRAHEVDVIVVAALDRLGRSTQKVLALGEELGRLGIDLVSCSESIDTTSPSGRFVFTVFAALAQLDNDTRNKRIREGLAERAKVDGYKGGTIPYGYRRLTRTKPVVVTVDPTEAKVVRRIFALRAEPLTLQAVADALNDDHVPAARGGAWYPMNVLHVLRNRDKYEGGKRGASDVRWPVILKKGGK
jgi:site-specific DNA recombinase